MPTGDETTAINVTPAERVFMVCRTCGSKDVLCDAWAAWDPEGGEWVLHSTYDETFCNDCEDSCSLKRVEEAAEAEADSDFEDDAGKTALIRDQNDRMRKGDANIPGQIVITIGVQELLKEAGTGSLERLRAEVAGFDAFDEDNDPYHEHDFGAFEFDGAKLYFKFDYFAPDMMMGSDDPSDLTKTVRVLTIMCTHEY